jgi:hypothetical protein
MLKLVPCSSLALVTFDIGTCFIEVLNCFGIVFGFVNVASSKT